MQFVNNYSEPVTLALGATSLALTLPDGEYRLTLADSETAATRWEIVGAVVSAGTATLARAMEGTADQEWGASTVIYCALTAGILSSIMANQVTFAADIQALDARVSALEPQTDGYFTADAGIYNNSLGRWEVPPGTTFTALDPGQIETDRNGGLGALIALIESPPGAGSNYGDFTLSGTFTFATSGAVAGNANGALNHLEKNYDSPDGAWLGATVDTVEAAQPDTLLYLTLFVNYQS